MAKSNTKPKLTSPQQMGNMSAVFVSLFERMLLAENACAVVQDESDRLLSRSSDPLSIAQSRLSERRAEQDLEVIIQMIVDTPAERVGDALAKLHVWEIATCGPDSDLDVLSPMERVVVSALSDLDQLLG